MANETESTEERLALQEKIDKLMECGWSDDRDDHYALRLMWCAGRDWQRRTENERLQAENMRLRTAIESALDDYDRRDEISAIDTLRAALSHDGGES